MVSKFARKLVMPKIYLKDMWLIYLYTFFFDKYKTCINTEYIMSVRRG